MMKITVCLALCIVLCLYTVKGVVFIFRNESIPTDGSALLLVTDTHTDVDTNVNGASNTVSYNPKDAVIVCRSTKNTAELRARLHTSYWYLDPEVNTTERTGILIRNNTGWSMVIGRTRVENGNFHRVVLLKRETDNAVEGKFTCHIKTDSHNDKYLLILYPILSVSVSVAVDFKSPYLYRIECISTGGRVLNMSITGPDGEVFPLNNIQPVGTQKWMGNDSYSGIELLDSVNNGTYSCEASNGVSSANDSTTITVAKKPINVTLERIPSNNVRVEWNHPSGRATITNYNVFYGSGNVTRNMIVSSSSTSAVISVFPLKYSISVMALLDRIHTLPGRSQWKHITVWGPEISVEIDSDSVKVYWKVVKDADYYTISFSQTVGDDQEGLCKNESHFANDSVVVNNTDSGSGSSLLYNTSKSNLTIINVGRNVDFNDATMLRGFTTYSVTVIPFSHVWGESVGSVPIKITTPQREPAIAPTNIILINSTSITIHVEWEWDSPCWLLNGPITGFIIQYHVENDSNFLYTSSSDTNKTLSGLHPSTNYTIRVAAVNHAGVGPYSMPIIITTGENIELDNDIIEIFSTNDGGGVSEVESISDETFEPALSSSTIIGLLIGIVGVVIAVSGIIIAAILCYRSSLKITLKKKVSCNKDLPVSSQDSTTDVYEEIPN